MSQPLRGIRVLELGQIYNVPYCALLLAAQGAEVIKVEPPGGETVRRFAVSAGGASYSFLMLNANKKGVTVNLKSEHGRALFLDLVQHADVVLENYRAGALDGLGLGYAELSAANPRVILASGRGYGAGSAYEHYAAMDFTVQAISGHMAITGYPDQPPVKAGATLCDMLGAVHLFGAVLLALRERDQTGRGRAVEVAMLDATYPALMSYASPYLETGNDPGRTGNRHSIPGSAPYGIYPTRDGWAAIMCVTDEHWRDFCRVSGDAELASDASLAHAPGRGPRRDEIDERVRRWSRDFTRDEIVAKLSVAGVPCAPVRTLKEATDDPYLRARGLLRAVDFEGRGEVLVLGSPIQLDDSPDPSSPGGRELPPVSPPPRLGEHNREVYCELLGLSPEELDRLASEHAI
jgi:formyl-CoA transferase